MVKTSPSNAENAFLISGQGTRSHMPRGQESKTKIFGSNIVTNSMKTLKMVHLKKKLYKDFHSNCSIIVKTRGEKTTKEINC